MWLAAAIGLWFLAGLALAMLLGRVIYSTNPTAEQPLGQARLRKSKRFSALRGA